MGTTKLKPLLRTVAFMLIFGLLLIGVQKLVTPRWDWPDETERRSHQVKGLYNEPLNSLDVLFVGASHMHAGISPMEIYRQSGIYSYNIATSGQPLPLSYIWLKTVLNRQSPKLVVLDVGGFYISQGKNANTNFWCNIMDTIPLKMVADRLNFVIYYNKLKNGLTSLEDTVNDFLPILRYHDHRDLTADDYADINDRCVYPWKGHVIYTASSAASKPDDQLYSPIEEVWQDIPEDQLTGDQIKNRERYSQNLQYVDAILALCKAHNCELLLTKMPVHDPRPSYDGSWTDDKHNLVARYAQEHDLKFLDLNYVDLNIDWHTETPDNGKHLNGMGARKVSVYLAQWLKDNYAFEQGDDAAKRENWQAQLAVYDYELKYYELHMEQDFDAYLEKLGKGNYTIFAAVSKAVGDYWTEERQDRFGALTGAEFDLFNAIRETQEAYAAVGANGALLNEDLDAEKAAIEGDLADGKHYRVTTSVASDVAETVITIDGLDYSAKRNGLRFVVYDNDLHCVVESAAIVTNNEGYKIVHSSAFIQDLRRHLLEYEKVALKDL